MAALGVESRLGSDSNLFPQCVMDFIPDARSFPAMKIVPDRSFRRKVVGQVSPAATIGQQIKYGVYDFSHIGISRSADVPSGNEGSQKGPLFVGKVGGVIFS